MTEKDYELIRTFEIQQPVLCPYCDRSVTSPFELQRVAHDVEACRRVLIPTLKS
jgi:hypothetical protein